MCEFYKLTLGEREDDLTQKQIYFSKVLPIIREEDGFFGTKEVFKGYTSISVYGEIFNNKMYDVITKRFIPYVEPKQGSELLTYRGLCYCKAEAVNKDKVFNVLEKLDKNSIERYVTAMYNFTNKIIKEYDKQQISNELFTSNIKSLKKII